MITSLPSNVFALGEGDYRIHNTIYDTFDFTADALNLVEDTIFGAFGHVLGTVTFQTGLSWLSPQGCNQTRVY